MLKKASVQLFFMQVIIAVKSGSVVNGRWGLWPMPKPPVSPETGPGGNHFSFPLPFETLKKLDSQRSQKKKRPSNTHGFFFSDSVGVFITTTTNPNQ